jgi:phosphoesterase RecJ-like protein
MHSAHLPILEQFKELNLQADLETAQTIALCWHLSPDGDCFGSMFALGKVLEKLWKVVHYYTPSVTPQQFNFLWLTEVSQDFIDCKKYDLIIATDIANIERSNLADAHPSDYADKFHMIDHHYGNNRTVGKHFLFPDIKSCCEILTIVLIEHYAQYIDSEIATLLLMGILTDSWGFTRSWDRSSDLYTSSVLVWDYAARKHRLQQNLFRSNSFNAVKYVGQLLWSLQQDWVVMYYVVQQTELDAYKLEWADIDLALFNMTSIDHDWVFIQFKVQDQCERPMLKCGFRTKSDTINVSDIAWLFWWWWHHQASGARIRLQGSGDEMITRVLKQVNEYVATNS